MTDLSRTPPARAGEAKLALPATRCRKTTYPPCSAIRAEKLNLQNLLVALKALGVASAVVTYSGGGDEGDTTGTTLLDLLGQEVVVESSAPASLALWQEYRSHSGRLRYRKQRLDLVAALESFAYDASMRLHGDWANNEGGDGEVTLDVASGSAVVVHNGYYTATDHTETVL